MTIITFLLLAVPSGIWAATKLWPSAESVDPETPTAIVKRMTIPDIVVEQGTIESQQSINGNCEAEGYEFKIIKIVPEGTKVNKGDVVVEFDSAQVIKDITEQELEVQEAESDVQEAEQNVKVQQNENETNIRQAKQEFDMAVIDLNKYIKGDFEVSKSENEALISEAQEKVDEARRGYENMRALVKKGFRQFEQLREAEQVVRSAELRLKQSKQKYKILLEFEHVKSLAQFKSKKEEAEFKLKVAKETAEAKLAQVKDSLDYRKRRLKRRVERLDRYRKNLEKFKIEAPDSGTVVYSAERHWRAEEIREGAKVYQNQTVFTLPNMRKMQVAVDIHESIISRLKPGLPATIKVDSFSGLPLKGRVTKVAPLAQQTMFAASKTYKVIVKIDDFPEDVALKPGMSAQVEILCGRYPNVIAVPLQAVASNAGKKFVYLKNGRQFELQEVSVGNSNVSFVEVETGVSEGDVVALDAFQRSVEDFGDIQEEELLAAEQSNEAFDPDSVEVPAEEKEAGGEGDPDSEVGKTSGESEEPESGAEPEIDAEDNPSNSENKKSSQPVAEPVEEGDAKSQPPSPAATTSESQQTGSESADSEVVIDGPTEDAATEDAAQSSESKRD